MRHADSRGLVKSSLEEENLSNATAAAYMNETTKKVRRVLDINACQEDLNVKRLQPAEFLLRMNTVPETPI